MNLEIINDRDLITMKLLYYFIKIKNYSPIMVQGAKNEIWLENLEEDIKIVRVNNNYIHNKEQMEFDLFKVKRLVKKIRVKTLSLSMKVLNIFTDIGDNVNFSETNKDDKNYKHIYANKIEDIIDKDIIKEYFNDLKDNLEFDEEGFQLFFKITNEINQKNMEEARKNDDIFKSKVPILTYSLIGIFVLIYILELFNYNYFINNFSVYAPYTKIYGQYYRIITGTFLHGSLFHLLSNCYALYIIGSQIENFFGKKKFAIIYLVSLISGSLMSMTFSNTASVGASGAIFGLMGSLAYFGYYYRVYFGATWKEKVLPVIGLNLILGFVVSGIDYFAHIGGLIGGIFITMAVGVKYHGKKSNNINGIILSIIYLAFLVYMSLFFKTF